MTDLSDAPSLNCLRSLSLSFPPPHRTPVHPNFTAPDLPLLPHAPNLTSLLLTLSSDRALFPSEGLDVLAQQVDFGRLTKLSILNLFCSAQTVSSILALASNVEELYLSLQGAHVIAESDLVQPGKAERLRILHVNAPERWAPTVENLSEVARALPRLEQVGSGNRVYEVHRRLEGDERVVELCRWSRTFTPGYFQNWRG